MSKLKWIEDKHTDIYSGTSIDALDKIVSKCKEDVAEGLWKNLEFRVVSNSGYSGHSWIEEVEYVIVGERRETKKERDLRLQIAAKAKAAKKDELEKEIKRAEQFLAKHKNVK